MLTAKPDDLFVPTRHLLFFRFPRYFMYASGYQFTPTHQLPNPLWFRWYSVPLSVPQAQISHPTFSLPASQCIVFLALFFFAPFIANSIQPFVSNCPASFDCVLLLALDRTASFFNCVAVCASFSAKTAKRRRVVRPVQGTASTTSHPSPMRMRPLPKWAMLRASNANMHLCCNVIHLAIVVLVTVDSPCLGDKRAGIFTLRHDGTLLPDCLEGGSVLQHLPLSVFIHTFAAYSTFAFRHPIVASGILATPASRLISK